MNERIEGQAEYIFVRHVEMKVRNMMNTKMAKEEVLAKFQAAKSKKREYLVKLEKTMKETYKKRTGKEAEKFFAL